MANTAHFSLLDNVALLTTVVRRIVERDLKGQDISRGDVNLAKRVMEYVSELVRCQDDRESS